MPPKHVFLCEHEHVLNHRGFKAQSSDLAQIVIIFDPGRSSLAPGTSQSPSIELGHAQGFDTRTSSLAAPPLARPITEL
jgi:hypothetical protein